MLSFLRSQKWLDRLVRDQGLRFASVELSFGGAVPSCEQRPNQLSSPALVGGGLVARAFVKAWGQLAQGAGGQSPKAARGLAGISRPGAIQTARALLCSSVCPRQAACTLEHPPMQCAWQGNAAASAMVQTRRHLRARADSSETRVRQRRRLVPLPPPPRTVRASTPGQARWCVRAAARLPASGGARPPAASTSPGRRPPAAPSCAPTLRTRTDPCTIAPLHMPQPTAVFGYGSVVWRFPYPGIARARSHTPQERGRLCCCTCWRAR